MTKKLTAQKVAAGASTALLALAGLSACGAGSATTPAATTEPATATTTAATTQETTKPAYAYLGIGDIPNNEDLTTMALGHYYAECTEYRLTDPAGDEDIQIYECQEAQDYQNFATVTKDANGTIEQALTSIDNKTVTASPLYGTYSENEFDQEDVETKEEVIAEIEANDDSDPLLSFEGVSKQTIALSGDSTEYDCYTYTYTLSADESSEDVDPANITTFKYFVDGSKLVAQSTSYGEGRAVITRVFHKITSEIPDGFIAFPNTEGLEQQSAI